MKKITKLLMLVTVAGIGLFGSCKDYNNDMFQEMKISDANLSSSLDAKYAELKGLINALQTAQQACRDNCKTRLDSCSNAIKGNTAQLGNHEGRISALEALNIATWLGNLNAADLILDGRITSLENALTTATGQTIPTAINNLDDEIQAVANDLEDVQNLLGENGANFTALQNAINAVPDVYATKKALNDTAADLRNHVKNEVIILNARIGALEQIVNEYMVETDETIDGIKDDLADLLTKYNDIADDVEVLNDTITYFSTRDAIVKDSLKTLNDNINDLKDRFEERDAIVADSLATLNGLVDSLSEVTKAIEKDLKNLRQRFNNLKNKVDKIDQRLKEVENQIEEMLDRLDDIEEALATQITAIVNQGVYNPMYGYANTPIGTANLLLALYGESKFSGAQFPVDEAPNEVLNKLTAEDLAILNRPNAGFTPYTIPAYLTKGDGKAYAGDIYFTVNPADADITGADFTLVDSEDNEGAFKIGEISPLETQLKFGFSTDALTRSSVTALAPNGLYKAEVSIDAADIDANKIDVDAFAKDVKKALGDSPSKINFKDLVLTVNNYFNGKIVAQAIKGEWDDAYGIHSVYSKYEYGAIALNPLSYNFMKDYTVKLPHISPLATVDLSTLNFTYDDIVFDGTEAYVIIDDVKYYVNAAELSNKINASLGNTIDNIKNSIVNEFNDKFNSYINTANSYINKINNATSKISSKLNSFNNAIQPALFVLDANGELHHLSTVLADPTQISYAAEGILLVASSYTGNLIAPSFKTFVGVTDVLFQTGGGDWKSAKGEVALYKTIADEANSAEDFNTVLDGGNQVVKFLPRDKKDVVYEIALSCLDYSGYSSTRKFYIKVVD